MLDIAYKRLVRSVVKITMTCLLAATVPGAAVAQTDGSNLVRLFKLEGTFSEELPAKNGSEQKSEPSGFALTAARLEADSFGFLTRLRALLTIANVDASRRITEVEWRIDVYDSSLRSANARVVQSAKTNIYAGETGVVSEKFGAVLPDRMIVLLQLTRVSFADGSAWSSPQECWLGDDFRTVSCKRN